MGRLALTFDLEIGIGIGFWKEEVSESREEKGREGCLLYLPDIGKVHIDRQAMVL